MPRDRYSLTMSFWVVPRKLAGVDTLRLGVGDVQSQQPRRGGVDRHRRVHLGGRDAVEQRLHVAEMGDRHADLADLAAGQTDRRGRNRSGSAGRRRSTIRSVLWRDSPGTARWKPGPSSAPNTSASATADRGSVARLGPASPKCCTPENFFKKSSSRPRCVPINQPHGAKGTAELS